MLTGDSASAASFAHKKVTLKGSCFLEFCLLVLENSLKENPRTLSYAVGGLWLRNISFISEKFSGRRLK